MAVKEIQNLTSVASEPKFTGSFDLAIVVVNYKTKFHLKRCLKSIEKYPFSLGNSVTVVVDNFSDDGSVEMVMEEFPTVKLIPNKDNRGFAKGCNQGIQSVRAEYYLLLNSDAAVLEDALDILVKYMRQNPDVGASGGLIYIDKGGIQPSTLIFPKYSNLIFSRRNIFTKIPRIKKKMQELRKVPKQIKDVPALAGGFIMMRNKALSEVGLLDERFFMYLEDMDICKRLHEANWRVVFIPEAKIIHTWGASSNQNKEKSFFFHHISMYKYFQKHFPLLLPLNIVLLIGLLTHYSAWFILGKVNGFSFNGDSPTFQDLNEKIAKPKEVKDVLDRKSK